jgi:glyoxylate/hydroxypyruvate reductase A
MDAAKSAILIELAGPDAFAFRRMDAALFGDRPHFRTEADGTYAGNRADLASVRYLLAWAPPPEIFAKLPALEVIFSLGAGADHLLGVKNLPDVPIVRFVDPDLSARMREYVVWQVLHHHRQGVHYRRNQDANIWTDRFQPAARDVTVGVLGAGVLGLTAAAALVQLGFDVRVWSTSAKTINKVRSFAGREALPEFLAGTDIAVSLLPLTDDTTGLLDTHFIGQMRPDGPLGGPVLINAGRGGSQNEADIAAALRDGRLMGASLDVFQTEPLPADSPLWDCPNLVITPHAASVSDPRALVAGMLEQIAAYERGEPLPNLVDRRRGY